MKEINVRITLTEEMLGTNTSDPEVYKSYIGSKAPDAAKLEEEVAALGVDEVVEKGMTVYQKDENGNPLLKDYIIKGFFKNACKAMREATGSVSKDLSAYKTKIDNLIFIAPYNYKGPGSNRFLFIDMHGQEMSICERPLRAQTAQGERIALASSESVPAGSTIDFTIILQKEDMEKYVVEWLNYGRFNGLGCWHNSGKGTFTWVDLDQTDGKNRTKKAETSEETPAPKKRGRKPKNADVVA